MRARSVVVSLVALCVAVGVLGVSATAWAGTRYGLVGQFGQEGAGKGSGNGEVSSPVGVAVDQSSGEVYVVDAGNERVQKFEADGNYVSQFDGSGTPAKSFSSPSMIAVDNSSNPFDTSLGDVYVVDSANNVVDKFTSAGIYVSQLTGTAAGSFSEIQGVAVDSNGNVWVSQASGEVAEFANGWNTNQGAGQGGVAVGPSGSVYVTVGWGGVFRYSAAGAELNAPGTESALIDGGYATGIAVDPLSGNVFVDDGSQVNEYEASGMALSPGFGLGVLASGRGIAFNDTNGQVYIADGEANTSRVDVFGPMTVADTATTPASALGTKGATLNGTVNPNGVDATCKFEYGTSQGYGQTVPCEPEDVGSGVTEEAVHVAVTGLEPNTTYHYRIVATDVNGSVQGLDATFTTPGPPSIDDQRVSDVGYTVTALHANINPNKAASTYRFEYGPTTAYGTSIPATDANIGEGSTDVEVTQFLSGLHEGATYHYRVVASSSGGTANGNDLTFSTYPATTSASDSCPNGLIRGAQFSSYLPDCRAYELVSPPGNGKGGVNIGSAQSITQAAVSGEAIKYNSIVAAFGDAQGIDPIGAEYVSQRAPDGSGWTTHGVNPAQSAHGLVQIFKTSAYLGLSDDLSRGVYLGLSPVVAGHPNVENIENLYFRNDVLSASPGSYELISDSVVGQPAKLTGSYEIEFVAASRDWTHVLFESLRDLTTEAQGLDTEEPKLYEWHAGTLRLAGILPSEQPAEVSTASATIGPFRLVTKANGWPGHAMSTDGARVVFTVPTIEDAGNIYMRVNGEKTVRLNVSERTDCADHDPCNDTPEPDPTERTAEFAASNAEDTKVLFLTKQALTNDAEVVPANHQDNVDQKLYMYDVNAPEGKHLKLITEDIEGDNPLGGVAAVSEDGEYVYFIDESSRFTDPSHLSRKLLHVWHDGTLRYVGGGHEDLEDPVTMTNWGQFGMQNGNSLRISRDGKTVVFLSSDHETAEELGYNNFPTNEETCADRQSFPSTERKRVCLEVYVYNFDTNKLVCVSCDPSGARPAGDASITGVGPCGGEGFIYTPYLNRPMSEDGRYVFFDTEDPLVPQDTNGRRDAYEYDTQTGALHLLSSGVCGCDSHFADASANGSDAFFATGQQLVRADIDGSVDMYDARIEGGIAGQNQPPRAECVGEECQGPSPSPPRFSVPASLTFSGAGNPAIGPVSKVAKPKSRRLTRAQQLARALRACRKRHGRSRARCTARARKTYSAGRARRASRQSGR